MTPARSVKTPLERGAKRKAKCDIKRIAIDTRTVLGAKTGDRTYTLNLLHGLQELEATWRGEFAFDLLLDAPDTQNQLPSGEGFQTHVIPAPNSRLWTLWAMPKWAWRTQPHLVHLQYLLPGLLPCPFVTAIHDVVWRVLPATFPTRDRAIMNLLMPLSARLARRVLTISAASKAGIEQRLHVDAAKIDITPCGVDARFFAPVSASQIEQLRQKYALGEGPYVLSVGVLQPRKNVPRLIEAFEQLRAQNPGLSFQLVVTGKPGWGSDADLAASHPQVCFTGYVFDEELPILYAGATVFAYPSLYEGFGLPLIEAMAAGCPVLTSNRGAMLEVAGNAAMLTNPYSVDSLSAGLKTLLFDADLRAELRRRGLKRAAEFTAQNQARATLNSYRRALNI